MRTLYLCLLLTFNCFTPGRAQEGNTKSCERYHVLITNCAYDVPARHRLDDHDFFMMFEHRFLIPADAAGTANGRFNLLIKMRIDSSGKMLAKRIEFSERPELDQEFLRVLNSFDDWQAARKDGKPVQSDLYLFLPCRLTNRELEIINDGGIRYVVGGPQNDAPNWFTVGKWVLAIAGAISLIVIAVQVIGKS